MNIHEMTENEFIDALDEFEFTDNGLVSGFMIRDYIQISVTKNMLTDTYTYAIENVPSGAYSYKQLLSTSDFGKFKAEFERLLDLSDDALYGELIAEEAQ